MRARVCMRVRITLYILCVCARFFPVFASKLRIRTKIYVKTNSGKWQNRNARAFIERDDDTCERGMRARPATKTEDTSNYLTHGDTNPTHSECGRYLDYISDIKIKIYGSGLLFSYLQAL